MISICDDLRKSVLQAAIQGRLTKQLPEDGNAEDLYKGIQEEKQRLIKEGKIKKEKALPEITEDDIPFDIPENWKWVRLNSLFNFIDYRGMTPTKSNHGVFLITASNVRQGYMDYTRKEYISENEYSTRKSRGITHKGDIIFTTEAPMGNAAICDMERCSCGQRTITFQEFKFETALPVLFVKFILSPFFQQQLLDNCTGTTAKGIKAELLKSFLIPLPPLVEQKRIVARVDELMAKIDEMEKTEKDITALYDAFPGDMKAALLQAAIQGKLTEQLVSDGDAETLYAEIQKEKQRLIKEGKIKKDKPLPEITEDDIPFDIPENWKWVRLTSVCELIMGSSPDGQSVSSNSNGIEFHQGKTMFSEKWVQKGETYTTAPVRIAPGMSILMSVRAPVGDVNMTDRKICIGRGLAAIIPFEQINLDYVYMFLSTKKRDLERISTGSTFKAIGKDDIINIMLPLPPLAEQKRIVEKLDQLLPPCDSMKEAIDA